ncbi:MAG: phage antirepressor KilAC domain-containing protein [Ruminiclostridium sp.]|nr:phage antirepressor KilAC domain-containing protein [Ruminiclostridium sp.]
MNDLITINYESERPTVSGRELHKALEVKTPYTQWFDRMREYGFTESEDFWTDHKNVIRADGTEMPQFQIEHAITIPMAKELCMLQRNEKGKQFRQYFIKVEEAWNSPEMIMKRALDIANENVKKLQITVSSLSVDNEIMRPKADYFDELVERNTLTNFRETAKQLQVGEKVFIKYLLDHKYIYRDKRGKIMPYADKNNGLFEVKESFNEKTKWSGTQTLVTPKGRETFRLLLLKV